MDGQQFTLLSLPYHCVLSEQVKTNLINILIFNSI